MKTEISKETKTDKSSNIKNALKEESRTNKKSTSLDSDSRKSAKNPKIKDIGKENAQSLSEDRSGDEQADSNKKGRLKNLAGFWSAPQEDGKVYRKKRLQIDESSANDANIQEEVPPLLLSRRVEEGTTEKSKPVEVVDPGYAKNMASMFQNRPKSASEIKKQVRLEGLDTDDNSAVNESGHEAMSGDDPMPPSSVKLKRRIKDLAGTFMTKSRDDDSSVQQPKQKIVIDKSAGGACAENIPSESDPNVVRSADQKPVDPILETCRTKGLAGRWNHQKLNQKSEDSDSDGSGAEEAAKKSKQAWWLQELEEARQQESQGVFENEPEVRDDVIRADDQQPDVISARITRKTRQLWSTIEQEKKKKKEEEERIAAEKEKVAAEKAAEKERLAAEKAAEREKLAAEKAAEREKPAAEQAAEKTRKNSQGNLADQSRSSDDAKTKHKEGMEEKHKTMDTKKKQTENNEKMLEKKQQQGENEKHAENNDSPNKPQDVNNKSAEDEIGKCTNVSKQSSQRSSGNKTDEDLSLVKTMKAKLHDDEDDWIDGSGLVLNNAVLFHIPRGKPLRGYVDE